MSDPGPHLSHPFITLPFPFFLAVAECHSIARLFYVVERVCFCNNGISLIPINQLTSYFIATASLPTVDSIDNLVTE